MGEGASRPTGDVTDADVTDADVTRFVRAVETCEACRGRIVGTWPKAFYELRQTLAGINTPHLNINGS